MSTKLHSLLATSALALAAGSLHASPTLIATGSISGTASDLSGLTGNLENGVSAAILGGVGSGLAWAGGNTFVALPDRGPNATTWNTNVDNTTSYIARLQTFTLQLNAPASVPTTGAGLGTVNATLTGTTLLYSPTALNYAAASATNNNIAGAPAINTADRYYFTGRSDNFLAGTNSVNPDNARFDPEGIRLSNDGTKAYVSDEYGPYVYQFDRATGARTGTYSLPAAFTAPNLSPLGATEISGNTVGRVANKGMEGLAITPNGRYLVGFEQSPLIQDGGDGGRYNRLVKIDTQTGATQQFVYDNQVTKNALTTPFSPVTKAYNSSELLAINDHQFLVLERDGKGLGDSSSAFLKSLYMIDLNGATDIGALNGGAGISGAANLATYAIGKSLFLDMQAELFSKGIDNTQIPAKIEGMAWGEDVMINGTNYHTLYVGNDNDFVSVAGDNKWFVFAVSDADLGGAVFQNQSISAIPEPASVAGLAGLGALGFAALRRRRAA